MLSKKNNDLKLKILEEVDQMVYSNKTKLEYDFESYLLKQELSNDIKKLYPGLQVVYQKDITAFKVVKNDNFTPPSKTVWSIQDDELLDAEQEGSAFSDKIDFLNLKELEKKHNRDVITNYRNEMGFTLVIEEMINCK